MGMVRFILLFIVAWGAPLAWAQPAQVILLRHAEKSEDPADVHLSLKGRERALALVPWLTETRTFLTNGLPAALFATATFKPEHSQRPQETLAPLARHLGQPVQTPFQNREYVALAQNILTNQAYAGKTVVICWVHDYIPQLAAALGVSPMPRKMKADEFDRVLLISFHDEKASLENLPQRLLYGDAAR